MNFEKVLEDTETEHEIYRFYGTQQEYNELEKKVNKYNQEVYDHYGYGKYEDDQLENISVHQYLRFGTARLYLVNSGDEMTQLDFADFKKQEAN